MNLCRTTRHKWLFFSICPYLFQKDFFKLEKFCPQKYGPLIFWTHFDFVTFVKHHNLQPGVLYNAMLSLVTRLSRNSQETPMEQFKIIIESVFIPTFSFLSGWRRFCTTKVVICTKIASSSTNRSQPFFYFFFCCF